MKRVRRDRPPWVTMHVYRASFMSVILPQTVSPLTRTTCSGCLMLLISEAISHLVRGTDYTHPGKISEAISYLGRGTDYSQLGPVAIHYRKSHKHAYVLLYLTLFWLYVRFWRIRAVCLPISLQGCLKDTGAILLPRCQWSNPEGY